MNERRGALLYRREICRVFAATLLKSVSELHIPDTDYRTRNMSNEQKLVSPSDLLAALLNVAQREGVQVVSEEESEIIANLKRGEIIEGFAQEATSVESTDYAASTLLIKSENIISFSVLGGTLNRLKRRIIAIPMSSQTNKLLYMSFPCIFLLYHIPR